MAESGTVSLHAQKDKTAAKAKPIRIVPTCHFVALRLSPDRGYANGVSFHVAENNNENYYVNSASEIHRSYSPYYRATINTVSPEIGSLLEGTVEFLTYENEVFGRASFSVLVCARKQFDN